ncbi:SIR2 family protein [Hydrogenophaga sp. SNF1]|uniref:SIR2 family protein n=1 Tax=Hydrogenophaga sp. SNF1 TaxID=3098762 RepID=UPI002ACC148C|nr:SIR2 family protein [Hydrogenophaga sp. SNF1]WQB85838.1 SIR2 family protein [Hydrogenophaga sp. SNF1]
MMIEWGGSLIKELAARRCIVFLGAGASADCTPTVGDLTRRPPSWTQLLRALASKLPEASADRAFVEKQIDEFKYLDAAEIIAASLNAADHADCMRQILELPRFSQSSVHESILALDPKIVITTNYDTIYDRYCTKGSAADGYNIIRYTDHHLVQQLRSPARIIVKAHGCITNTDNLVLTRSSYFNARRLHPHFFKILDALCLTHTILFVGYSLNDPDVQLALENANISAPSTNRHYFVVERGAHAALKNAAAKAFNLEFLEFDQGDYVGLQESLRQLVDRVLAYRNENPDA